MYIDFLVKVLISSVIFIGILMLTLYFLRKKNVIIGEDIKQIKIGNAWIVIFNYNKKKYIIGISQNSITVIDKIEE